MPSLSLALNASTARKPIGGDSVIWRILISGAGTTTSNGEYVWDGVTLENGQPKYISTNGNYIFINESQIWSIWDFELDRATYISYGNLTSWEIDDASEPSPSATLYYTP